MQYSNLTEFISESALRKRIGGCFCGTDDSRYAEAGFYPVEYAPAAEFQTHDKAAAYLENGKVIIPVSDMPLEQIIPQARERINEIRKSREFTYIMVTLEIKQSPFPCPKHPNSILRKR